MTVDEDRRWMKKGYEMWGSILITKKQILLRITRKRIRLKMVSWPPPYGNKLNSLLFASFDGLLSYRTKIHCKVWNKIQWNFPLTNLKESRNKTVTYRKFVTEYKKVQFFTNQKFPFIQRRKCYKSYKYFAKNVTFPPKVEFFSNLTISFETRVLVGEDVEIFFESSDYWVKNVSIATGKFLM